MMKASAVAVLDDASRMAGRFALSGFMPRGRWATQAAAFFFFNLEGALSSWRFNREEGFVKSR